MKAIASSYYNKETESKVLPVVMSNDNTAIFAPGYNRSEWDVVEPKYELVKIGPTEEYTKKFIKTNETNDWRELDDVKEIKDTISLTETTSESSRLEATTIADVYDTKNQLSSLLKNAQRNQEAIKIRNERIKQSKIQSRNRYGW